ncbi:MAG: thioredoxin-like domain-containing protein [Flavobacteriales bacterium]
MQQRIPAAMWISLSLSLFFAACASGGATESPASRSAEPAAQAVTTPAAAPTPAPEMTAAAATSAPAETPAQQVSGGGTENPDWMDGINDDNRGDKVGKVAFSGSVQTRNGMMYLFETEGRNIAVIDSAKMTNGQFDFGKIEVGRGFYGLGFEPGKKTAEIVFNPDEPVLRIDFQNGRLVGGRTESRENRAWFAYRGAEAANKNQIRQLYKQRRGNEAAIDAQVKAKEKELAQTQHKFIRENPGTYMAKFLTWKQPRFIGDKGTFLSDIDMSDNSLPRSMALPDRIQSMMRTFSDGKTSGFLSCIDLVKASCEENPVVLEFALYNMLDGFYNMKTQDGETICQYILDNYIFDEDCGANLSDVIRQRAQGIINLRVGNTPPNFKMADPSGQMVDLSEEVAAHEYTLLMFWASWCHKCEQEIPNLVPMYQEMNPRGFGMVGVSVDQQKAAWTKAIADNQIPWKNVSQLKGWDAPITDDYKITQTPTYFLLDKEGKIVMKPERWFEVQRFLQSRI